jgi:hypothetical protein
MTFSCTVSARPCPLRGGFSSFLSENARSRRLVRVCEC